jgi:hypothetical protein
MACMVVHLTLRLLLSDNNIITLYIPTYTLYILQALDVRCFSPLKHAYKKEVITLVSDVWLVLGMMKIDDRD